MARLQSDVLAKFDVSRETFERLEFYVAALIQWQRSINLVSPSTLDDIWTRHILDSLQVVRLAPSATRWVDLGSGAGLPGLVIAIALFGKVAAHVDLVESNAKKASFLRHVVSSLALPCTVHCERIERVVPHLTQIEIVTARALASLDQLLDYCNPLLKTGARGLFLKGRAAQAELTEAALRWHFKHTLHPSITERDASVVELWNLSAVS